MHLYLRSCQEVDIGIAVYKATSSVLIVVTNTKTKRMTQPSGYAILSVLIGAT